MKIKRSTIEDILYFSDGAQETLLIKVRGRGWFKSSGHADAAGLTLTRLNAWLQENNDFSGWERVKVQHFHMGGKKK